MAHHPCDVPAHQTTVQDEDDDDDAPVSASGGLRIQFKGADGTIRTKVFRGLDKVQVLREVVVAAVAVKDGEKKGDQ